MLVVQRSSQRSQRRVIAVRSTKDPKLQASQLTINGSLATNTTPPSLFLLRLPTPPPSLLLLFQRLADRTSQQQQQPTSPLNTPKSSPPFPPSATSSTLFATSSPSTRTLSATDPSSLPTPSLSFEQPSLPHTTIEPETRRRLRIGIPIGMCGLTWRISLWTQRTRTTQASLLSVGRLGWGMGRDSSWVRRISSRRRGEGRDRLASSKLVSPTPPLFAIRRMPPL